MPQKIPELGQLIKTARFKARLTQSQLASRCYLTADYIYKLESGLVPSVASLSIIFEAVGLQKHFEEWRVIIENLKWE